MYQVVGQSYSVGLGVESGKGAAQLLAAYLKEEEKNFGVSGAVLYYSKVAGGYATVANKLARTSGTYLRGTDYGLVWFGGNDLFCMDSTFSAASQSHLKSVFRFAISRMCAGKIFDDEDASIVYAGFSKSSELGESKVTGKFTHFATANGSKVTISVPSGFPGGTVAVYLNAENGTGGTWAFKVDGVSAGELSTKYTYGVSALSMFCKRFTGLAPGAHTIECTVSSITTYAAFDSWAIEAPAPPTVIVPGQFKLNAYGTGETHNPVDADVTALEKLIKEACEEFGSYVKFVSLSSMDHTTHVQADQLHPTTQGHEEIFALFKAALEEAITYNDSATATISSSGSGTESARHDSSGTAALTGTGSGAEAASATDAGSALVAAAGSGAESASGSDAGQAALVSSGSGVDAFVGSDAGPALLALVGSGIEGWEVGGVAEDAGTAVLVITGSGVESSVASDGGAALLTPAGAGIESAEWSSAGVALLASTGGGLDSARFADAGVALVSLTGSGVESAGDVEAYPGSALTADRPTATGATVSRARGSARSSHRP